MLSPARTKQVRHEGEMIVAKKKVEEKTMQTDKSTTTEDAAVQAHAEGAVKAAVAKAQVARAMRERRRQKC